MKKTEALSFVVTTFVIVFICEVVSMQIIYDSMDFFRTPLSFYATGNLWYIVSSGLLMIGTSYIFLAYLFMKSKHTEKIKVRIGAIILIIVGLCAFLLTIFQTDVGQTASITGHIHVVSAHLHFAFLPFSIIFLSLSLTAQSWRKYRIYSLIFSSMLITIGIALVLKDTLGISNYSGFIQKTLILSIVIWIMISAQALARQEKVNEVIDKS
jgi:hypothetical protein